MARSAPRDASPGSHGRLCSQPGVGRRNRGDSRDVFLATARRNAGGVARVAARWEEAAEAAMKDDSADDVEPTEREQQVQRDLANVWPDVREQLRDVAEVGLAVFVAGRKHIQVLWPTSLRPRSRAGSPTRRRRNAFDSPAGSPVGRPGGGGGAPAPLGPALRCPRNRGTPHHLKKAKARAATAWRERQH